MGSNNKKKVVFLLGAGASSPFIKNDRYCLSTAQLTDELLRASNWKEILDRFDHYKNNASLRYLPPAISLKDVMLVMDRVEFLLSKNAGFKNDNFEYIIHMLDGISDYFSSESIYEYGNIDTLLFNFWFHDDYFIKRQFNLESNIYGWGYLPFLSRELIVASILKFWKQTNNINSAIDLYKNYFDELCDRYESVGIYSFNYDPLLSSALIDNKKFNTGFVDKQSFQREEFFNASNIIAFMHGHSCFAPSEYGMYFEVDIEKAYNTRISNLFSSKSDSTKYFQLGMKGISFNTYIVTGLDKMGAFTNNPFSAYFYRFVKDVFDSDYTVVIGASLLDDHINSFLYNYFVKSENKIIYVTCMKPESIKESSLNADENNKIMRLMSFFGDTFSNPHQTHLDQLCNAIQSNGYGKLTDHVVLYANGCEQFFRNGDPEQILSALK